MSSSSEHPDSDSPGFHELVACILEDDLAELKELLALFPEYSVGHDEDGRNLLHLSILYDRCEIFNYLLSLDLFDLEAVDKNGKTALIMVLTSSVELENSEHFGVELINKGANIDTSLNSNTLLHLALRCHFFKISRALIEKGADINVRNSDGNTPLHMIFNLKIDPDGVCEGVGLMLYYGADASVPDNYGNLPFELALTYDPDIFSVHESLFYYTFDSESEYAISSEVLFELLEMDSPLFPEVAKIISIVVDVKRFICWPTFFFRINPEFLQIMIEKFDSVVKHVLVGKNLVYDYDYQSMKLECWDLLLQSHLRDQVIELIGKFKLDLFIRKCFEDEVALDEQMNFIYFLLSHGLPVYDTDVEFVYKNLGYCQLFKELLHMDILRTRCDVIPRIIWDMGFTLDIFLDDPFDYSLSGLIYLMNYFALPGLRRFCYTLNSQIVVGRAMELPAVPLLVELARDATRRYLVDTFNLHKSSLFYSFLKSLPISDTHEKILSFETKLY